MCTLVIVSVMESVRRKRWRKRDEWRKGEWGEGEGRVRPAEAGCVGGGVG